MNRVELRRIGRLHMQAREEAVGHCEAGCMRPVHTCRPGRKLNATMKKRRGYVMFDVTTHALREVMSGGADAVN